MWAQRHPLETDRQARPENQHQSLRLRGNRHPSIVLRVIWNRRGERGRRRDRVTRRDVARERRVATSDAVSRVRHDSRTYGAQDAQHHSVRNQVAREERVHLSDQLGGDRADRRRGRCREQQGQGKGDTVVPD